MRHNTTPATKSSVALLNSGGLILLALSLSPVVSTAQTVSDPGFTISTYVSGLPVSNFATGLTMNPFDRTLFVAEEDSGNSSRIFSISSGLTVTNLGTSTLSGYPYVASDIQYLNGNIYADGFSGQVTKKSATTPGAPTLAFTLSPGGYEMGLATDGTTLYASSGVSGSPTRIVSYNPTTNTVTTLPGTIIGQPSTLEYNPVDGLLYFTDLYASNTIRSYNLTTGAVAVIASLPSGDSYGNFAISPDGETIYTRTGNTVRKIALSNGATQTFVTGLSESSGYADMVFGPASSGLGWSLYLADGAAIRQIQGFDAPVEAVPEMSTVWMGLGACGALLLHFNRRLRRG